MATAKDTALWGGTLKPALFVLLSLPLLLLGYRIYQELMQSGSGLGADPVATLVDYLGIWSIRLLLLALAVSPLRRLAHFAPLARVRRMLGLFAFTYISLHLLAFLWLILGWDGTALWVEIRDRPYITLGFAAFILLLPMAITSTKGWQRRLGRRWQILHRGVFPAAVLAMCHWLWLTKDGFGELSVYALVLVALLAERLWVARGRAFARATPV